MESRLVGGDGAYVQMPVQHFWVLAPDQAPPDRFAATAIWEIEQKYNPERGEEDIQWFAAMAEGTENG